MPNHKDDDKIVNVDVHSGDEAGKNDTPEDAEQPTAEANEHDHADADTKQEIDWQAKYEIEHEKHLRAVAELHNFRRRTTHERAQQMQYANERLLHELLYLLDNLDQALRSIDPDTDVLTVAQGIQMICNQLRDIMGKFGVSEISALHQQFDPQYHEAIERVETDEIPQMTVLEVLTPGYMLHDRVLRPARVNVAVRPATSDICDD